MTTVKKFLSCISLEDNSFVGTITLKSGQTALPDGSRMALGFDTGICVLLHEKPVSKQIEFYEYNSRKGRILKDKRMGCKDDLVEMKRLISYFFDNANVEDLITIFPPERKKNK